MQNVIVFTKKEDEIKKISTVAQEFGNDYRLNIMLSWETTEAFLSENGGDLLILSIDDLDIDGMSALHLLREDWPNLKVVAITRDTRLAVRCFELGIFDFWARPFTRERVRKSLSLGLTVFFRFAYSVYVKTIPNLDVFVDMKRVIFRRPKCRELFAFLVDRNGTPCSTKEILAELWPEAVASDKSAAVCRNTFKRLREELESFGIDGILKTTANGMRFLDTSYYEADIRRILRGDYSELENYDGRYLAEYEWSEVRNFKIMEIAEKNRAGK